MALPPAHALLSRMLNSFYAIVIWQTHTFPFPGPFSHRNGTQSVNELMELDVWKQKSITLLLFALIVMKLSNFDENLFSYVFTPTPETERGAAHSHMACVRVRVLIEKHQNPWVTVKRVGQGLNDLNDIDLIVPWYLHSICGSDATPPPPMSKSIVMIIHHVWHPFDHVRIEIEQ